MEKHVVQDIGFDVVIETNVVALPKLMVDPPKDGDVIPHQKKALSITMYHKRPDGTTSVTTIAPEQMKKIAKALEYIEKPFDATYEHEDF